MKKYKAFFSNTKVQVKNDEGESVAKELGFVTFFHFPNGKVSLISKAFMMATGAQQDADRVEFLEVT